MGGLVRLVLELILMEMDTSIVQSKCVEVQSLHLR